PREDLGVENAVLGQVCGFLEGGDGLTRVVAAQAVDNAGREVGPVQQDLCAGDGRIRRGGRRLAVCDRRRGGGEHRRLNRVASQCRSLCRGGWLFGLWRLGG